MYRAGVGGVLHDNVVLGKQDGALVTHDLKTEVFVVDQIADGVHVVAVLSGQDICLGDGLGVFLEELIDRIGNDGFVAIRLIGSSLGQPGCLLAAKGAEGQPHHAHHPGQSPDFGFFRKGRKAFHGFPPSSLYPWPQTTLM